MNLKKKKQHKIWYGKSENKNYKISLFPHKINERGNLHETLFKDIFITFKHHTQLSLAISSNKEAKMNDKEWVLRRERKKAAREFGTDHTDYSRTRKTGADSKAPTERVAGTA